MKLIMGLLLLAAFAFGDDHGDSASSATPINLNSATAGNIGIGGDVDFFKIVLPRAGALTIYTTGNTDTYGYLLDSSKRSAGVNDDSGEGYNFKIIRDSAPAGTYYIKVRHYASWRSGNYTLHVRFAAHGTARDDYGNSISTAKAIRLNSITPGYLERVGDVDFFKIVLPTSGILEVTTTEHTDTFGYLLNSAGSVVALDDDSGTRHNFKIIRNSIAAGTYYIKVKNPSRSLTGSYALHVLFTAIPTDDHGNSISSATTVAPTSITAGDIETNGDVDYFKIVLPTSGHLKVYTTSATDTFGYLLNSAGGVLALDDDSHGSLDFQIVRNNIAAGTYYVKVRHYSSSRTGSYAFYVEFTPRPAQGVSMDTAISIGFNSMVYIMMSPYEDARYYKFEIPQGRLGRVSIYSTGTANPIGHLDSSAYDPARKLFTINNAQMGFRINQIVGSGVYYIKLTHADDLLLHVEF